MKLAEWIKEYMPNELPGEHGNISKLVPLNYTNPQLWGLEDYRVTSCTGGMVWLIPRK